ncbi:hypothetical protein R9C00_08090 [Flammeovirgaceae bacterium SG7u.111]|nr:hypothetical protein [Flammeovirgaceae bacterium SG7u.132]WPO37407.1 hypothetical protein R9C00_08090 [Flammeovirgaceae bacterium SG7u.111]
MEDRPLIGSVEMTFGGHFQGLRDMHLPWLLASGLPTANSSTSACPVSGWLGLLSIAFRLFS